MAVAAPARARRRAPISARQQAPARIPPPDRRRDARRPDLRVVTDARVVAAKRQRRLRALVLLVGFIMTASLFALAAFHAVLATGQAELDRIEAEVSDAQAQYERLRLDVAELEAPSRIVREAQTRLGMLPPPDITYLAPSEQVASEVSSAAGDGPPTAPEDRDRAAWSTVKPYLTGRP